jgi:predicted RNA-binding Zn-ribbon protein involved in translation (DUF1610 family)
MKKKMNISRLFVMLLLISNYCNAMPAAPPVKGIGIVVKKNPGSGASRTLSPTNENGVTEFKITEKGNYVFTFTELPINTGDINGQNKDRRTGIKGVKVGLGKNPSGTIVAIANPNEKGEIEYKNLNKGSYYILTLAEPKPGQITDAELQEHVRAQDCPRCGERAVLPLHRCRSIEQIKQPNKYAEMVKNEDSIKTANKQRPCPYCGKIEFNHNCKEKPVQPRDPKQYASISDGTCCGFVQISMGAGYNKPNSATAKKSNALADIAMLAEVSVPLMPISKGIDLSLVSTIQYGLGNGSLGTENYEPINIIGQYGAPVLTVNTASSAKQSGTRISVAPQLNIRTKKLCISPSVGIGAMLQMQQVLTVNQTTNINGTNYNFDILKQEQTKTNGLLIVPKLRLSYCLGKLAVWAETQYLIGPSIKNTSTKLIPEPIPVNGAYYLTQVQAGTYTALNQNAVQYRSIGGNAGVSIPLGRMKPNYVGHVTLLR